MMDYSYAKEFEVGGEERNILYDLAFHDLNSVPGGVLSYKCEETADDFFRVRIDFYSIGFAGLFLEKYGKLKEENKMKDKEIKTTQEKVLYQFLIAESDETKNTLKKLFPDAFRDGYKWVDVTYRLKWQIEKRGDIHRLKINALGDEEPRNIVCWGLFGYMEDDCEVIRIDDNVIANLCPKKYYIFQEGYGGFTVFRKEKI